MLAAYVWVGVERASCCFLVSYMTLASQLWPNLSCGLFELLWSYLLHSAAADVRVRADCLEL